MLKSIKWLLLVLFVLGAIFLGMLFTYQNNTALSIVFFGYISPQWSSGLWLTIALLLGAVVGFFLSFLPLLFARRSKAGKSKKIEDLQKEVDRLRLAALKG